MQQKLKRGALVKFQYRSRWGTHRGKGTISRVRQTARGAWYVVHGKDGTVQLRASQITLA